MDEIRSRGISVEDACTLVFGPPCGSLSSEYHTWSMNISDTTPEPPPSASFREPEMLLLEELNHVAGRDGHRSQRASDESYGILHISDTHFDPEYEVGCKQGHLIEILTGSIKNSIIIFF